MRHIVSVASINRFDKASTPMAPLNDGYG